MKIAYITAQTPWGKGETFILEEMLEMKNKKVDFLIIPRNPSKEVFNKEAKVFLENSIWLPLLNFKILNNFFKEALLNAGNLKILVKIIIYSRSLQILAKNLVIFPKAVFIAKIIKEKKIEHIHSHWGSTTATMAYIVSKITNIPWSFTLHRWDIKENNMLMEKIISAEFTRCISEHGEKELLGMIGRKFEEKVHVVYMGVKIPENIMEMEKHENLFKIAIPANLVEKKGHKYLIEACEILVEKRVANFQCTFYGDGPLKIKMKKIIKEKGLGDYVNLHGIIPHSDLLQLYQNKKVDLVVLPSIITKEGELEGIPVALMEAMAYGVPVISTNTGGIPELLSEGSGIIVNEKSPEELCEAIRRIMTDENLYRELQANGQKKIREEFSAEKNTTVLLRLFKENL